MRIKYIKQITYSFDVEEWMQGSGYIQGKNYAYFMHYRDLDCWQLSLQQGDGSVRDHVVIKEPMNLYFIACDSDEVLTPESLQAFIQKTFDSVEYSNYQDTSEDFATVDNE
ncbi:hypothetical protein [Aerococcus kribbianus]|uniref:Uncharacterized protein n=1 Tax=Aerococcus kribbianus TaxID=2999064 RepID=A0A9X3FUK5_9LACT|nr:MULTISPECIES: hypothetical protein [unclassified Aerococcus]MCZ0717191.1 hypothetical protein [Aerococcus sp. YH-aer221]MCZ0725479.1 hypothetical protein [Aerococcus sp. YH-aer222]